MVIINIKLCLLYLPGKKPEFNENTRYFLKKAVEISEKTFPKGLLEFQDVETMELHEWTAGENDYRDVIPVIVAHSKELGEIANLKKNEKMVALYAIHLHQSITNSKGKYVVVSRDLDFFKTLAGTPAGRGGRNVKKLVKSVASTISHELGRTLRLGHHFDEEGDSIDIGCVMDQGEVTTLEFCDRCRKKLEALLDRDNYEEYLKLVEREGCLVDD